MESETKSDVITDLRIPPHLGLANLFAGKSPDAWRALYAGAYDWGADAGREIVEDRQSPT